MDEIYLETFQLMTDIYSKVDYAGMVWARETGDSSAFTCKEFNPSIVDVKCDTSAIKSESEDGSRGINVNKVESLNSVLTDCFEGLTQSVQSIQKSIKGNEFLGGNQTEELQTKLNNVEKKIASLLESTEADIDNQILTVAEAYLDQASDTANKFSIDGKNVDFSRITNNSTDSLNGKFWSEDSIHKNRWGDNESGKLDYEIKEDGSVLITEDGTAMGWTDRRGLINAISKENGYIPLKSGNGTSSPKITPGQTKLEQIERRDQNPSIGESYTVSDLSSDQNGKVYANLQSKTTGEKVTGIFQYNENGDVTYTQYEKRGSNSN